MASPTTCAFDSFKLSVAARVSSSLGVTLEQAWEAIESGKVGKNVVGDFTVAIPRFRLPGDQKVHAKKLADEVSTFPLTLERERRGVEDTYED